MKLRSITLPCLASAALSACGHAPPADPVYPLSPVEVLARLRKADITGFRDARQCGVLIYFSEQDDGANALTWTVTSGSFTVARFTLRVTPAGSGSTVAIDLPKAPNGGEIYDASQKYTHPALMQPLRPALRELVNAAIERRGFDWHRIPADQLAAGDGLCGSERQNLEAGGAVYSLDDPEGMTHQQAEDARAQGMTLPVTHDHIFMEGSQWAK